MPSALLRKGRRAHLLGGNDGTTQAALLAADDGSRLILFSDLGIERVNLIANRTVEVHLRCGGQTGIVAVASERSEVITIHDKDGELVETLPSHGWDDRRTIKEPRFISVD